MLALIDYDSATQRRKETPSSWAGGRVDGNTLGRDRKVSRTAITKDLNLQNEWLPCDRELYIHRKRVLKSSATAACLLPLYPTRNGTAKVQVG